MCGAVNFYIVYWYILLCFLLSKVSFFNISAKISFLISPVKESRISQLRESISFDCYDDARVAEDFKVSDLSDRDIGEWLKLKITNASRALEQASIALEEEVKRCERVASWIKSLKESL